MKIDITAPGKRVKRGSFHPLTQAVDKIVGTFVSMGFEVVYGPETDSEYYNFDSINVPRDHPARDMQDTFWLDGYDEVVMRTQLSGIQAHYMEKNDPPIRIVYFGKNYRNESTDATHEAQFNQIECLVVDKKSNLSNLKYTIEKVLSSFFGSDLNIRMRPGYFPFVEPGVEIDMSCFKCKGKEKSCPICKGAGWIEILGAGTVQPSVLKRAGINPNIYQGFAFAVGLERMIMLKYGIDDIREFHKGDLRFLKQF